MLEQIFSKIDEHRDETIQMRRYLHQHPELSFHEYKTAKYIANVYQSLGIPYETEVGGNGIVARLKGGKPGKTICLRADFDALPIQDEKNVPYKSTVEGVMHACGHDGHTAVLLTVAKALQTVQDELPGTVIFLHQHAEETHPGGAKPMIDAGVLNDVDAVFGTHLWTPTPVGTIETSPAAFMAGVDQFNLTLQGAGGHGGYPHQTKDTLVIGAEIVTALQSIVSRKLNPLDTAVLTIGEFHAGNAFNIIADRAEIVGTVRYADSDVQETIMTEMKRIIHGMCQAYDITCTFNYHKGYPPLINHEREAKLVLEAAKNIPEVSITQMVDMNMAGEDFSYYMEEKPGAYFFTGARKEDAPYPHHHPKFDIDERALPIAAKSLVSAYFAYQEQS